MTSAVVWSIVLGSRDPLEATTAKVRAALDLNFEPRDSLHLGGDYFVARPGGNDEEIRIRNNVDLLADGEPEEPLWSGPTIVTVDGTMRPEEIIERLAAADVQVLRRVRCSPSSRSSAV